MAKSAPTRLTKAVVERMQSDQKIQDLVVPGFGVRKQKTAPTYFLKTYVNGRRRWFTIGKHGAWTVDNARKEARRLLVEIQNGNDPGNQRALINAAPTVKEAAGQFLESHGVKLKPRTKQEYERLLNNHILKYIGTRKIQDLDVTEIKRLHAKLKTTPRQANFAIAIISKLLSWAEEQGTRPPNSNPCSTIKRYDEVKHQRYLTTEEFKALGQALAESEQQDTEGMYAVAAIRLLVLTGARKSEILTLQWRFIDLERGMIFLPDSKTGQKPIYLNQPAVDLLDNLPHHAENPYVLPGAKENAHLVNLQKPWNRIRKAAGLPDVRIHDLRHSYASIAAGKGGSLPLIGGILGHTNATTTQRYAHLAAQPIRQLNDDVGEQIKEMLGGEG